MWFALGILILVIIALFILVIFYPSFCFKLGKKKILIQTFYIPPLIGAIILLIANKISIPSLFSIVDFSSSMNPIKILILFFSISFISLSLDQGGFFQLCAKQVLKYSKGSSFKFFILLYLIVSILTIFTSNDIVILTFTPFICYYCTAKKINPLPYLFIELIAANSWSMMLEIGNPTNIYLGLNANISFFEYFNTMLIPTIITGIVSFILVICIFKKDIFKSNFNEIEEIKTISNNFIIICSLIHLILCIIGFTIFSDDMHLVSFICALSLILWILIYDIGKHKKTLIFIIKKLPFSMIPFLLAMFLIVSALNDTGMSKEISLILLNVSNNNKFLTSIVYGFSSLISCNLLNNIPMSVLFSSLLKLYEGNYLSVATYASIAASNLGALLTPIGSLAGIMWISILKQRSIKINFLSFIKYCGIISIVSALFAFASLLIVI